MQRFYRERWAEGTVYVLDVDRLICRPDGSFGLLIEEKHKKAPDRNCRITRMLAQRLGWWSALFVYETADGTHRGDPTRIDATFWDPNGKEHKVDPMDFSSFYQWVCGEFGARAVA